MSEPRHYNLVGSPVLSGDIHWQITRDTPAPHTGVTIHFYLERANGEKKALAWLAERLAHAKTDWLKPAAHPQGNWIIDLDGLRESSKKLGYFNAWAGRALVRPHFEYSQQMKNRFGEMHLVGECHVWFTYPKQDDEEDLAMPVPNELQKYLEVFRMDHPQYAKTGFVMMRFKDTPLQLKAFETVRDACAKLGVTAVRVDAKEYAAELYSNIRTYMHGCGFGIAIFERIVEDQFNPNVSLEIGYMLGMGKPVLMLKDNTLEVLHADLVGHLYASFDTQRPADTIPPVVEKWLRDKGIIA